MASVIAGANATLTSLIAEQQLIESVLFLWMNESISARNPTAQNSVTWTLDSSGSTFRGNYSIPATQSIQAGGALLISADPYLTGVTFAAGSGGTYSGATIESATLERIQYVQGLERQSAKNPNNRNFVTGTFDSETDLYQGSFSIPVIITLQPDGSAKFVANPYLLD